MAYKGSLFQVLDESGEIRGELVFDSIVSEEHEVSNKVTEFPIDSGYVVSDHVIRKNRVLTMNVVSVRHTFEGRQRDGLTAGKQNKIKEDFDLLNEMVQKGLRCNVVTILGAYTNCVVVKFKTKQDVDTSTILQATIVLKEMNVVGGTSSTSRQALIDTANSTDGPDPDAALKSLMGDRYSELEGSNDFGGF
jgi:hypothetical protein